MTAPEPGAMSEDNLADARKGVAALRQMAANRRAAGSPMGDVIERYANAVDAILATPPAAPPAPGVSEAMVEADFERVVAAARADPRAAARLMRIYFDIAADAIGQDEVRRIRDERIVALARPAGARESAKVERCENGCSDPVTHHDLDGVPLCQGCVDALAKEQSGEEAP